MDRNGTPHVVPICYAIDDRRLYTALDRKPKRVDVRRLRRVRNIAANPRVSVVIDRYSEDWSELGYVLLTGTASVLEGGEERGRAEAMLREKYPQYADMLDDGSPIIAIHIETVVSWGRV